MKDCIHKILDPLWIRKLLPDKIFLSASLCSTVLAQMWKSFFMARSICSTGHVKQDINPARFRCTFSMLCREYETRELPQTTLIWLLSFMNRFIMPIQRLLSRKSFITHSITQYYILMSFFFYDLIWSDK